MRATLTVTGGAGGGTATLDVEHYEAGRTRQVRPQSDCRANGVPVPYTLGAMGGLSITDTSPETLPTRVMLTALFPDLPDRAIDPDLGDTWVARSPETLLALLPFPEPFNPALKPFKSKLKSGPPGDFEGRICVQIQTEEPLEVHGEARTRHKGKEVKAYLDGSSSGEIVLELERGLPLNAVVDVRGKINIHPFMFDSVKMDFKYGTELRLLSD
jgi:hypothetical protein